MKCPACNSANLKTAKFCNRCGKPLAALCPGCEASNPPGSKFCNQCGRPLDDPETALPRQKTQPLAYTPKFLADKILDSRAAIEGERKRVTVLFADVADFTAMSERLDAEEMHAIMDGCFTILMEEIHKYEGTINQFTGDGVMALFGAPLAHEDHAQRACYAALQMQRAIRAYGRTVQRRFGVAFKMRIGLNSGPVVVGAIGDDLRMDYTAIGDTTNLSARMESLAEPGTIRVSHDSYRIARDYFEFEALGPTRVKGKAQPQKTYELRGSSPVTSRLEASVRHGLTRYVGRRNELAALTKAFADAAHGRGQVVGIAGEPGVGKSRLIYELRRSLGSGSAYVEGRCVHYGRSIAFLPLKHILRGMLFVDDGDDPAAMTRKINQYIRHLGLEDDDFLAVCQDLLGVPVGSERWKRLSPKERKDRTFGLLREFLLLSGKSKPLVLVVDDLHWIDRTSETFLDYLIQKVPGTSILILLVYRPEYRHSRAKHPGYHELSLTRLPEATGAELITSVLDSAAVAPDLIRFVLDRSDGNPLFIEELSRTMVENGTIHLASDRYVLDPSTAAAKVPESVHGIIAARMDRLEEDLKRVVQVAAVIGRDFAHAVLQRTTGLEDELNDHLARLENLALIYRKHRTPELAYIFKHALTQEVAYNSLLRQKRAGYHARVASAVEQLYADRLEESYEVIAYHYERSADAQKAFEYLKLSGEKAIRTHFLWEAYDYFKKALGALDRLPHADEHRRAALGVLHLMIIPIIALGLPEDSLAYLEKGVGVSKELDDHGSMTRFYSNIGVFHMSRGNYDQGTTYTQRAFDTAKRIGDVDAMAQSGPDLCQDSMNAGKFKETIRIATQITDAVENAGREADYFGGMTNIYSIVKAFLGYSRGVLGDFPQGLTSGEDALACAVRFAGPETIGVCEAQLGSLHLLKGNHALAFNLLRNGLRHLEEANFYWQLPWGRSMFGLAQTFHGDPRSGLLQMQKALAENRKSGIEWRRSVLLFNLGVCRFSLAEYPIARRVMDQAHALAVESGQGYIAGKALTWMGRIQSKLDPRSHEAASDLIGRGIDILSQLDIRPEIALGHLFLGNLYSRSGKIGEANAYLGRAKQMFNELGMNITMSRK